MNKSTISLHLFRVTQAVWALALLMFVAPLIVKNNELSPIMCLYLISFVVYTVASVGIFLDLHWAWILSVAFLAAYWILRGWIGIGNFVVNSYMFISGHELYRDSPMTIIIVVANALFGIFPASILLILGIICRHHILKALRGKHEADAQTQN